MTSIISNICLPRTKRTKNYAGTFKALLFLFWLLGVAGLNPSADGQCPGHNGPSCNFYGYLSSCVGSVTVDTIVVAYSSPNPTFSFSFITNSSGGDIGTVTQLSYSATDSLFVGTVPVISGPVPGNMDISVMIKVQDGLGCNDSTLCTKSITIIDIEATAQFDSIACMGGTTTLTVIGTGGSIDSAAAYRYTLQPNGTTNTTGIFTNLPAGTYSVNVGGVSIVDLIDTCFTIVTVFIPDGSNAAVHATCPVSVVETSCTSQLQINADFTAWETAFGYSADAGAKNVYNTLYFSLSSPPDACAGGTVNAIDSVFSSCDTVICTSSFTVTAFAVSLTCPPDFTDNACQSQAQINADFTGWLAMAKGSGGCNGVGPTNNNNGAPNACTGGTATVTFTYTNTCAPFISTCTATFTVPAAPTVQLTCPPNFKDTACHTQAQINADFTAWLAQANASGGCNGQLTNNSSTHPAPDACAGGTATVTFTYTSTCAPFTSTCSATFTVPAPLTTFKLTCPNNFTEQACLTQSQVNTDFAAWLLTASTNGGCGGTLTHDNAQPPSSCGGTTTCCFTFTNICNTTSTCCATFTVPFASTVQLSCPKNFTDTACHTQAQINANFTAWLASAKASGGCNGSLKNNNTGAPDACSGGTATVTFTYASTCAPFTYTCTATFTVPTPALPKLTCPVNFTENECLTQTQVNGDFTSWLNTAKGSGGCKGILTNNAANAPDACKGGTATVTFTYTTSTCGSSTTTCTATFTTPAAPPLQLMCEADQTIQGGDSAGCGNGSCVDLGGGGIATAPDLHNTGSHNKVKIDFTQPRNAGHPAVPLDWTNGALNETQADYVEGMGVPQRIILSALSGTTHSLIFRHEAVKHQSGDRHAYDFLMSWQQAIATAGAINGSPNVLQDLIAQTCYGHIEDGHACDAVTSSGNVALAALPAQMGNPPNHHGIANVNDVISCFEAKYGDRTIEMDGNAPITAFSIVFDGYDGTPDGDNYAWYTINWTSASDEVVIKLAGRAAASGACGYGACFGAGSISGAPYHFKLEFLDNASLGNRDNQVMVSCLPACTVEIPPTFNTPTVQGCNSSGAQPIISRADSISYDQITGDKTTCRFWNITDPVCRDSAVCRTCITVTCGSLRRSPDALTDDNLVFSAYPNPFNSQTTIQFTFSANKPNVTVEVFSLNGEKITSLFNSNALAGATYDVTLNAKTLPDGIYIYRIATDKFYYGKLVLMK